MDEKERDEWRKTFTAIINKENPNKLTEIIRRVNQMIEELRKKRSERKKAAGAE